MDGAFGKIADFHRLCGTSHIVAPSLLAIPPDLDASSSRETILERMPSDYLLEIIGSHRWIAAHLAESGTPLEPLPFPGAVYHVGHGENHTAMSGRLAFEPAILTERLRREFAIPERFPPAARADRRSSVAGIR
jgi:hypothetical protein